MNANADKNAGGFLLLGICLAVGMIVSSIIASRALERIKAAGQTIRVKGTAQMDIVSDFATWRASYSVQAPQLAAAYEKLKMDTEAVKKFLNGQGVPEGAANFEPVLNTTQYGRNEDGYPTNEIEGYLLTQPLEVQSENLDLVTRLSKESASLIEQDIGFSSNPPSYLYTKIEDLKVDLLGAATKDALRRAGALAENSGSRVGRLRSASQGVFQITPRFSTEIEDYGMSDTTTVDKTAKAVVTMEFSIE
jgi:hypothetical protein